MITACVKDDGLTVEVARGLMSSASGAPTIEIVSFAEIIPRVRDLTEAHRREYGYGFDLNLDVAAYDAAYKAGRAFAVHAFDDSGSIGYCSVFIAPHIHNPAILQAACDGLFVREDRRGGLLAGRIIRAAEDEAVRRGLTHFLWYCKSGTPIVNAFLKRGYVEQDVVLSKEF